jgi:hypothetical protein
MSAGTPGSIATWMLWRSAGGERVLQQPLKNYKEKGIEIFMYNINRPNPIVG